jgi:hypothetical protein
MNAKNGLILSIMMNIGLLVLVFYVKHNITQQAKEAVKAKQTIAAEQVRQAGEIYVNNNLLWETYIEINKSADKSIAGVTRIVKAKRIPGREAEKAFLLLEATSVDGQKARRIGWEKYSMTAVFNDKDQLADIDVDDLLGKAAPVAAVETEEE